MVKNSFTPAFFIFAIVYAVVNICDAGMMVHNWDEYTHWADVVKAMWMLNDFGTNPASNSAFASYPPAMALLQYFLQVFSNTITGNNVFSEWRLYLVYQTVCIALFLPFLKNIDTKNKIVSAFFYGIIIFLVPTIFFSRFYDSVYIDPFLGLLAGFGISYTYHTQAYDGLHITTILLCVFTLVLTKAAGLIFAIAVSVLFAFLLFTKETPDYKSNYCYSQRRKVCIIVITLIVLIVAKYSWSSHVDSRGVTVTGSSPVDLKELLAVFIGNPEKSYRRVTVANFLFRFFEPFCNLYGIGTTITGCMLVVLFIVSFYYMYSRYALIGIYQKRKCLILCCTCCVLWLVYFIGMCIMYMFKFSSYEAVNLASYERYLGIPYLCFIFILNTCGWDLINKKAFPLQAIILSLVLVFMFSPMSNIISYLSRNTVQRSKSIRAPYESVVERVSPVLKEKPGNVWVISQEDNGLDMWVLRYTLRPNVLKGVYGSWSIGKPFYEGDVDTIMLSPDDWQKKLVKTYNYVLLYRVNDYFRDNYASLFYDPSEIGDEHLYRVDEKGMLTLVG